MTLIPDERIYSTVGREIGNDEVVSDFTPETAQVVKAALATENTLSSLFVMEKGLPDGYIHNPEFSPFDLLTEAEKNDPMFSENAMLADTKEELNSFRVQFAKETKNRQLLQDAGAMGAVVTGLAALLDPVNLIPVGGVAYKTYKGGHSILTGAIATASTAVGITAVTEAGLHATQLQRTYGESVINMSGAFLLGGALGAGAAKLASPKLADEIVDVMDVEPKIIRGEDSVGAMSAVQDVQITGKVARGLAKILGWDPLSRTLTSKNPVTRSLSAKLAESPYLLDGENLTAVQSRIKVSVAEHYNTAFENHLAAFKQFRKDGGKLSRREFNALVSRQQRDPDVFGDPNIAKAADGWESGTYNPIKGQAIEVKLLPDDIQPKNAVQYLNRQWLPDNIAAKLPLFLEKTEAWLKTQKLDSDIDIPDLAKQISRRLQGQPDGMLPYDYDVMTEKLMPSKEAKGSLSSSFKPLSFQVNSRDFEEFIENDIEILARNYVRRTIPDIEFTRAFDGDLQMTNDLQLMEDWYQAEQLLAKSESARQKLSKQMGKDKRDLIAMNERIRGIYKGGRIQIDPDSIQGRMMKSARDLNYLRFMGGVVPASFSDVARITMAEGLVKTFSKGLIPMIANIRKFKVAASEAKSWGIGDDMITGNRVEIIADVSEYSRNATAVERGIHSAAQTFSKINLMNQWTAGMKQIQSVVMQNEIVPNMIKGKTDKRLVRLGISEANQINIGKQLKKSAVKDDGFWMANVSKWDNPELALMYKTAMRKESDRVIVVPGEEKPLWMSDELGKTIFQFRSFMLSATQRVLISGIQGQDANFMSGMLAMVTMGMSTYAFKQWDAGRELSDDPMVWIGEGIDRSGALGSIMEINNTIEKISSNSIGLRPLLGITTPASRFASRDLNETFLGPTFGALLSTTLRVAGAASSDYEWTDSDTRAMRRLLPYQNLAIFRQGIDQIEKQL